MTQILVSVYLNCKMTDQSLQTEKYAFCVIRHKSVHTRQTNVERGGKKGV